MRTFLSLSLVLALVFSIAAPHLEAATKRTVSFPEVLSTDDLAHAYAAATAGGEKVRILVMPGHEPQFGGAEFAGYYEREFVVDIADALAADLRTDPNFEVFVARGNEGWNTDFTYYFDAQGRRIERFVEDHKEVMEKLEKRGRLQENDEQAAHNEARSDVALRLYGINKWANENDIDLVLHLHLNDDTDHAANQPGVNSGVAIYVPDSIYGNAKTSRAIAEPVFARLNAATATSTSGLEQKGILEDRDLIAIGAFNTADMPSLLIEYGYLYEPRLTGGGARTDVLKDYAYQTALGVRDYFGTTARPRFDTKVLPYTFTSDLLATTTASTTASTTAEAPDVRSIYALQSALRSLGHYPAAGSSLTTCPVDGFASACVTDAVKAFQKSKGLEETGTLGPSTRTALNAAFGIVTTAPVPSVPLAGACTAFTQTLVPNATDKETKGEVSRLQALLAKDPTVYPEALVTGYFGPATLSAVKRFQEKNAIVGKGSAGYGLVGPFTQGALLKTCSTS